VDSQEGQQVTSQLHDNLAGFSRLASGVLRLNWGEVLFGRDDPNFNPSVGLMSEQNCSPRFLPLRYSLKNMGGEGKGSMSSIKRDVKKKVLPRPEGEKILSRDPAHFTVRVPLDLRERVCF
jgi:hypothetical protein